MVANTGYTVGQLGPYPVAREEGSPSASCRALQDTPAAWPEIPIPGHQAARKMASGLGTLLQWVEGQNKAHHVPAIEAVEEGGAGELVLASDSCSFESDRAAG